MNIAIVGLNQLFDVDIDKVNKPYLPLASGEFSMATGVALVAGSGAAALALGAASGSPPLMATLIASAALGVLYSTELPFMRWKRSPLLAAACILAVRALAVQLGFFFHMKWVRGRCCLPGLPAWPCAATHGNVWLDGAQTCCRCAAGAPCLHMCAARVVSSVSLFLRLNRAAGCISVAGWLVTRVESRSVAAAANMRTLVSMRMCVRASAAALVTVVNARLSILRAFGWPQAIGAGAAVAVTPSLAFTVSFMLLFSIVIALFKDIPDVKGDEAANVRTFSVRFGQVRQQARARAHEHRTVPLIYLFSGNPRMAAMQVHACWWRNARVWCPSPFFPPTMPVLHCNSAP